MGNEKYFVGTEMKIAISITCDGFDMDLHDWTAVVKKGNKSIVCDRNNNTSHDENGWYLLIDSAKLGGGRYELIVDIDVPDPDFDDSMRHETYKQELFYVKGV